MTNYEIIKKNSHILLLCFDLFKFKNQTVCNITDVYSTLIFLLVLLTVENIF